MYYLYNERHYTLKDLSTYMSFKKPLIALAITIGFVSPVLALAQTSYLNSLLGTVQTLTEKIGASLGVTTPGGSTVPAGCLSLTKTMSIGSTDAKTKGEVTKLQTFLQGQGFFTNTGTTGYFGTTTRAAVGAWQSAQGIVFPGDDGYGVTGPKTRAAIIVRTCSPRNEPSAKPATNLSVAAVAAVVPNSDKNIYYISPTGNDSAACTATAPCATFKRGYAVMSSGDTLIVKNGRYTNLPFLNLSTRPPNGTASAYTQVVAETDGGVTIDGVGYTSTWQLSPFWFESSDPNAISYLLVRGFVFKKQPSGGALYAGHHIKLIRNGFEDGSPGNSAVFNVGKYASNVLVEESYAYGSARYKFLIGGQNIILRRVVARFDSADPRHDGRTEPIATFAFYSALGVQCQNCISIDGDHPEFWMPPEEYSGSFSLPSTSSLQDNATINGSIAFNVGMQFLTVTKSVDNAVIKNSVAWNMPQASLMREGAVLSNMTFGNIGGQPLNTAATGLDHWGGGYYDNPAEITNSILYKISGTALTGFNTVTNNVFYGNTSNGSFSGSGNITTTNPNFKYILRTSDSAVPGKGANVLYRIGKSGTLWGEAGWDETTTESLWPYPYEDVIARDMKAYSYTGPKTDGSNGTLSGNRGFAALYPTSQHPLTDYLWSYNPAKNDFSNPVPTEFASGTQTPSTTYTITASATVGGSISPSGAVSVVSGGSQAFTITPSTGYEISDVKVNNTSVSKVASYTFSNVVSNQTIAATFTAVVAPPTPSTKFIVGDRVQTTTSLNVRSTPSTSGASLGTQTSGVLGTVTSGPTAANGYNWWNINYDTGVDGWSVEDYLVKTTTPPPGTTYTITASSGANGTVSPAGASTVASGGSKTYTITPSTGYAIASVLVNGTSVGAVNTYTFSNVTANQTISATFSQIVANTPLTPPAGGPWTLTFNDEFSGSAVNTSAWQTTYPDGTCTNNDELQCYTASNATVSNGLLHLKAEKRNITAGGRTFNYASGLVSSYPSFSQTYGYFEMRAKFPGTNGFWPAFWLLPKSGAWPPEIDVIEHLSKQPSTAYFTMHYGTEANHQQSQGTWNGPNLTQDYHVYAVDWQPNSMVWYVDGVERYRLSNTNVPNVPMFILANLAVGGSWAGAPDSTTVFPNNMEVDYIRAWSKTATNPTTYTITASAGANGTVSPAGASTVASGGSKTYTITPSTSEYQIASVLVNGVSVGAVSTYTFSNVTANQTISATFVHTYLPPPAYTITASAGSGGSISPSGSTSVQPGNSQTYTITPNTGYDIYDVKVNNVSVGKVTSYTFSSVTANATIAATFSAKTSTVPVPNPAFSIGTRIQVLSTATVRYGAAITQTITGTQPTGTLGAITNGPKTADGYIWWNVNFDGSTVDGWTIQDNLAVASAPVPPPVATSTPITYTITATAGTGGTISPSGSILVTSSGMTYTISPAAGYTIAGVTVNGTSVGAVSTYTFSNVSANQTIAATFSQIPQFNCPCSILSGTPATALDPDTGLIELGMKFTPSVSGKVTGVRFYKGGSANSGTHVGKIWTAGGQQLGSVTFSGETSSGWQTAMFASPVSVSANTTYVVSYNAPKGRYSANNNYFGSAIVKAPLTAPVNAGVYKYGGGFPTDTYQGSNYWVDVIFTPNATVAATSGIEGWLINQLGVVIGALETALELFR